MPPTIQEVNKARNEWVAAQSALRNRTTNDNLEELKKEESRLYEIWYNLHVDYYQQFNQKNK